MSATHLLRTTDLKNKWLNVLITMSIKILFTNVDGAGVHAHAADVDDDDDDRGPGEGRLLQDHGATTPANS